MKKDKTAHIPKLYNDYSCKAFTYIKNFCNKLQYINEERIVIETNSQIFGTQKSFTLFTVIDNPKSFCLCRLFLSTLITILEITAKFKYIFKFIKNNCSKPVTYSHKYNIICKVIFKNWKCSLLNTAFFKNIWLNKKCRIPISASALNCCDIIITPRVM